jgi:hypothetical protein
MLDYFAESAVSKGDLNYESQIGDSIVAAQHRFRGEAVRLGDRGEPMTFRLRGVVRVFGHGRAFRILQRITSPEADRTLDLRRVAC